MPPISRILIEGESIIWSDKQNRKTLITLALVAGFITILAGLIVGGIESIKCTVNDVPTICHPAKYAIFVYLVGLLTTAWWFFSNMVTNYYLTNKRVLIESGLIGRDFISIYFDKVETCDIKVGLIDKIFGTGSISIDTGKVKINDGSASRSLDTLANIDNAYEVYQQFQQTLRTFKENLYK